MFQGFETRSICIRFRAAEFEAFSGFVLATPFLRDTGLEIGNEFQDLCLNGISSSADDRSDVVALTPLEVFAVPWKEPLPISTDQGILVQAACSLVGCIIDYEAVRI
ncbi:MAG: hypothetical protein ACK4ZU_02040 [Allorhizobium sp.]